MSCPNCQEGFVLTGEPTGSIMESFQGAYHAPSPQGETSKFAIIFLTDGFGLPLKNCKIMADNLAQRLECDVWVPDYFDGRPLIPVNNLSTPDRAGKEMTIMDWIKFVLFTGIPSLPAFIHSRPAKADKRITSFIAVLKEKKQYDKLGVVGYCFGGATADPFRSARPELFEFQQPEHVLKDIFWPRSKRLQVESIFEERKDNEGFVEYEFKDYKGTAHGFAARPNLNLPEIKDAHERAFEQTVHWFKKTLEV